MKKILLLAIILPAIIATLALPSVPASAKEAVPEQAPSQDESAAGEPPGGGKAVTTTIIKRCPGGYELVTRANGRRACAKDIMPPSD
jgi:hypothetical protein